MTPEQELARDLFMAELWPVCREVDRVDREIARVKAARREEDLSAGRTHLVDNQSTNTHAA